MGEESCPRTQQQSVPSGAWSQTPKLQVMTQTHSLSNNSGCCGDGPPQWSSRMWIPVYVVLSDALSGKSNISEVFNTVQK